MPPLLDVLAPVAADDVLSDVVLFPVEDPPVEVLLVFPPVIVPLVFPPAIVPVVVFVGFCSIWVLFVGLIVRSDAFEFAEVPLWLLVLTVPVADEGLEVSPMVWLLTEQDVAPVGQGGEVSATACEPTSAAARRIAKVAPARPRRLGRSERSYMIWSRPLAPAAPRSE